MKPYENYQQFPDEQLTERGKEEQGSPFWGEGKFNNFVKPFLKEKGSLVDMGCNAGLFLKMAEDIGYQAIGVDSNKGAVEKGLKWRDDNGYKYQIIRDEMIKADLPIVDYTLFVNAHYYITVNDFLDYLDKLQYKTRYCVIVTDKKNHLNRCWASAEVEDIRSYFRNWQEVGFIDELPQEGKHARRLKSLCFKSQIEKCSVEKLDSSNHVQDEFCAELDEGKHYTQTRYYRILRPYRKNWSEEKLNRWMGERVRVYEDIKKNGLKTPIIVDKEDKILDGNHRYAIIRHLKRDLFIRKV